MPPLTSPTVRQTARVGWVQIQAGQDILHAMSKGNEVSALAELVWNGLDAEADSIDVEFETASLDPTGGQLEIIEAITISDNGHGMSAEVANRAFPSLGDSWKKSLNGRTLNGRRVLHGSRGQGRFRAYVLGNQVEWTSVSATKDGFESVVILGNLARIGGFAIGEPTSAVGPTGTRVRLDVDQERGNRPRLLAEDLADQLAIRLAAHLLGNPDIQVRVNGVKVDPTPLVEGNPTEIALQALDPQLLGGREVPVLTIIDWSDRIKAAPGLVLCNPAGASILELEKTAPRGTVRSSGYLKWSAFSEPGAELTLAQLGHAGVIQEAQALLERHVGERTDALKASIVATLKSEGAYPYADNLDPVVDAARQMYDLVVVTARSALVPASRAQRAMSARLLRLALETRPENLELILTQTLRLSEEERDQLADMLRVSSLAAIVAAASEVSQRLDLITALRHLVYDPTISADVREVDQLHPLIKDNIWLFGETWRLAHSEAGLTTVLRAIAQDKAALEADLISTGGTVRLPDGKRGRVDLLLERVVPTPTKTHRLVIELKRPSVAIGREQLQQTKDYATALHGHAGVGPCKWEYWAIGADTKAEIALELEVVGREWGHVTHHPDIDIYVTTWSRLLDDAALRYNFYRDQLGYEVNQDTAIDRVRHRHAQWLPQERTQLPERILDS